MTLKSRSDRERPPADLVGFSILNFSPGCKVLAGAKRCQQLAEILSHALIQPDLLIYILTTLVAVIQVSTLEQVDRSSFKNYKTKQKLQLD